MSISLTNIRVNNFRSLENIDLTINKTNIIIGQNNCGKSNLLKAINIAFGNVRDIL
ncbi:AAA family ATPase [Dehalobacterium formicoaceticum]|uniref:AAA family ATPase n=1 Tax=Dehalobacterium formicoaceticum TaxID=51515 RepID=UPI000B7F8089